MRRGAREEGGRQIDADKIDPGVVPRGEKLHHGGAEDTERSSKISVSSVPPWCNFFGR
jgi:hypothetical protein